MATMATCRLSVTSPTPRPIGANVTCSFTLTNQLHKETEPSRRTVLPHDEDPSNSHQAAFSTVAYSAHLPSRKGSLLRGKLQSRRRYLSSLHYFGRADGIHAVYDRRQVGRSPMGAKAGAPVSSSIIWLYSINCLLFV